MKRPILKGISLMVIVVHLVTVCFRDASFAAGIAAGAFKPPGTLMPNSYGGTSVGYAYQTNISTGKANLNLSFNVPPGRKGLQPSLGIVYENNQMNSFLGVGWSMEFGAISRSTKKGLPKYDSSDAFVFSATGAAEELVKISDNEYRPKIEGGFTRYIFYGNWWEAIDKSGSRYRFGYDSGSRQESAGLGAFKWCLDRITDIHGNYISISYQSDQGEVYPFRIEYTGFKEEPPLNGRVEFVLEPRDDVSISYRTRSKVVTAKRLKEILILQKEELVRRYVFNYILSATTSRSLLSSIVQYGRDNQTSAPALTLTYSETSPSWQEDSRWAIPDLNFIRTDQTGGTVHGSYTNRDQGRRLFDINADGLTDLIVGNWSPYEYKIATYLNTGSGWLEAKNKWIIHTGVFVYNFKDNGRTVTDLNADGKLDPLIALTWNNYGKQKETYLSVDGDNWTRAAGYDLPDGFLTEIMWKSDGSYDLISDQGRRFADLNADGLSDFIVAKDDYRASYLNTGSGWQRNSAWDLPSGNSFMANSADEGRRLADINSDGLTDLLVAKDGDHRCYLNTGNGFVQDNTFNLPADVDFVQGGKDGGLWLVDLNGDGLIDLSCSRSGFKTSYINTGFGWRKDDRYNINDGDFIDSEGKDLGRRLADVNGDGLADFLIGFNDYKKVYLNQAQVSDMLVSFTNGIGAKTDLTYQPSTRYDNTGPDNLPALPFIIWTVSKVTSQDGLGNSYQTSYAYKKGYFAAAEREFRGFGYVKVIDVEGNYTESYFKQDAIFKGRPYKQETKDAAGTLYTKSENTWQTKEIYPGVNFVYLEQADNYLYDEKGSFKQTRIAYEYDAYGNPVKVKSFGDLPVSGDEKTQITEYVYNTKDWLLGLPKHTQLLDQNNAKVSEKWFYYDGAAAIDTAPAKGLLGKEETWLYNPLTKAQDRIATTYAYDKLYGNLISATDALGRTTTTTYDSDLHTYPVSVTNALGHTLKTAYDYKTGQVLSTTDPNNQTTTNVYDALGRLTQVIGPNDSTSSPAVIYEYDLGVKPIKITKKVKTNMDSPSKYPAVYSFYDGLGRLIQTKSPAESDSQTAGARQIVSGIAKFDARGQVKEKYLPYFTEESADFVTPTYDTPRTSFTYDAMGRLIKSANPDGTSATLNYSLWKTIATDENSHYKTQYQDAYGQTVKIEEHNGSQTYTTVYEYDALGNLTKLTDNQRNITQIFYDSLGRKIKMSDPDMGAWTYEYDKLGNLTKQTDAKGQVLTFAYDALNRLISKKGLSPKGTVPFSLATYYYDSGSNGIGRLSKITDQSGSTAFFYDNLGREIKSIKTVDTSAFVVQREYDTLDRLTKLTYPDGEIVTYTYDANSGLLKEVEGLSPQGSIPYVKDITYTSTGQIKAVEYGNGTSTDYTYDPKTLRLTNLVTNSPAGRIQDLMYQFDNVGNISSISDYIGTASQSFVYDDLDRLIKASGSYGTFGYDYDSIGNMIYKEGVNLTYGKNGKLPHAVTKFASTAIDYDANGNMLKKGNLQFSYDIENRLLKSEDKSTTPAPQVFTVTLQLNPGWNFISLAVIPQDAKISTVLSSILVKVEQVSRYNPATKKFEHYVGNSKYDQFTAFEYGRGYQLYLGGASPLKVIVKGTLPLSKTVSLKAGCNLVFNPKTQETPVETALSGLKINVHYSKVLYYNVAKGLYQEYSKDKKEFTTLKPGVAYYLYCPKDASWAVANPPVSQNAAFVYDGDGGRVKKGLSPQGAVPEQSTVYIGSLFEKDSDGTIRKHIFAGANRICTVNTSEVAEGLLGGDDIGYAYYHSDHLGSSNVITDQNGQQVQYCEYTPYGTLARNEGADLAKHKFTGKELDNTGLYFFGARYYSAELGRFITADPTIQRPYDPQDLNRYTYCRNNPVNYTDPTGLGWKSFWKKVAGFVGAAVGVALGFINPFLGMMAYSLIAASGQGGNFGKNFGINFASSLVGWGIGAGVSAAWGGGFWSGLAGAALGGAGAGAATSTMLGGNAGMGALAGLAGGTIGYLGGFVWPLGADAVAGGVSSVIMGGDFGEGAAQGAYYNMAETVGGILAPMQKFSAENAEAGDIALFKADSPVGWAVSLFEGGPFSHVGIVTEGGQKGQLASTNFGKNSGFEPLKSYEGRGAYVSTRYRGNQSVINTAKALSNQSPKIRYGFFPGQKVCSTFTATSLNKAGYGGWYGIGPNSQQAIIRMYGED